VQTTRQDSVPAFCLAARLKAKPPPKLIASGKVLVLGRRKGDLSMPNYGSLRTLTFGDAATSDGNVRC
jgi:hypothetical protein